MVSHEALAAEALMRDLVPERQTQLPIKMLEGDGWNRRGTFYVHVATEVSYGSAPPPGAMPLVEPIDLIIF